MEGGWKTPPPPVLHQPKKPSANRVKVNSALMVDKHYDIFQVYLKIPELYDTNNK